MGLYTGGEGVEAVTGEAAGFVVLPFIYLPSLSLLLWSLPFPVRALFLRTQVSRDNEISGVSGVLASTTREEERRLFCGKPLLREVNSTRLLFVPPGEGVVVALRRERSEVPALSPLFSSGAGEYSDRIK